MKVKKTPKTKKEVDENLNFEEIIEGFLQVKPIENEDLKEKPKKKKQTKSKKK